MNATSFLTNISRNLQSLETQIKLISTIATTSDESKIKLEEIQKSISDIKTLIQQQQNSFKQHSEMVEQHINQLKLNQDGILNKLNEVLFKIESSVNQNCTLTKSKHICINFYEWIWSGLKRTWNKRKWPWKKLKRIRFIKNVAWKTAKRVWNERKHDCFVQEHICF